MPVPPAQPPAPDIVGRSLELEAVDRFLDRLAAGGGMSALLVEGDAGVGKSMLWRAAVGRARGRSMTIVDCAPAAAESGLSFVALRDLLDGVADSDLERLPPPQRTALEITLLRQPTGETGDGPGEAVDPGALGVAFTAVLRRLAERGPILLAIDDTQWLDPPSTRVLSFAMRRLGEANIGLLLTRRTGEDAPFLDEVAGVMADDAQRIRLGPISFGALHRLLTVRTGQRFARPLLARIELASGGNPMTALEIARALIDAGQTGLDAGNELPVPERLRDLLGARLARLHPASRSSLLVAAVLSHPTRSLIAAGSDDPAVTDRSLVEAEQAGIVAVDDERVRFTHPLFASALQADASAGARRRIHGRLAEAVTSDEERAHHLALAATEPDAALAERLEAAGARTVSRGAPDIGAGLLARAGALTPAADLDGRGRRAILEATARMEAGDLVAASAVLDDAAGWLPRGGRRAEALYQLGIVTSYLDRSKASGLLVRALADAAEDSTLRGRIHSLLALFEDDFAAARDHGRKAVDLIDPAVHPSAFAFAQFGMVYNEVLAGQPADLAAFEAGLSIEGELPAGEASTIPALWWKYTDQHELARTRLDRHLGWARDSGDESSDAELYAHLAELELYAGRWAEADLAATRSLEAAEQTGQGLIPDPAHRMRALVDAHLGRLDEALAAATAGASASRADDPELEAMYLDVLGTAALASGDARGAAAAFDRLELLVRGRGILEPLRHRTEPDHIEALVASGAVARAGEVLRQLERRHEVLPRPWIAAALPRSRALVRAAGGDVAGAAAELAATVDGANPTGDGAGGDGPGSDGAGGTAGTPSPAVADGGTFAAARALLVLGRLERQLGRRRSAGERLDRAAALFDLLPAPAWAAQTRQEIDRLGRRRGAGDDLTPAEQRVIDLIATGLTNRAVAAELVLSPKTVEAHVARAYAKLGIRSRAQLGRRLALGATVDPGRGPDASRATDADRATGPDEPAL